jgi:hypothetical protein
MVPVPETRLNVIVTPKSPEPPTVTNPEALNGGAATIVKYPSLVSETELYDVLVTLTI